MSTRAYEIAFVATTEALLKDPVSGWDEARQIVKTIDTVTEFFTGAQVNDPNAVTVVSWDSADAHKAFQATAANNDLLQVLSKSVIAPSATVADIDYFHVQFDSTHGDPLVTLRAPVTEITRASWKEDVSQEDFLASVVAVLTALKGVAVGTALGYTVEKPREVVAFLGWDNLEAYNNASGSEEVGPLLKDLASKATDLKVAIAKFNPRD
ncbi:hypothetical protein FA95DRAFT_1575025 [Auriscalpium vulgare]|uniref:Uncharacterized protein n=1 Tax=Auriscalpium vulgare TaxID=40419 RepID=A0ACB8RIR7_9AGAM|nr:hypothetical protein FA95DRAFT_1575025 [Auriscalpium vulgare]